jgi:RecB family endonuclease NucS
MPIYTFERQNTTISKLEAASFNSLGILERQHLQAALKNNIQAISPCTLIISEEFCEWDDSNRRIDLLGIDRDGNIIIIELKRDATGAHMELQALCQVLAEGEYLTRIGLRMTSED